MDSLGDRERCQGGAAESFVPGNRNRSASRAQKKVAPVCFLMAKPPRGLKAPGRRAWRCFLEVFDLSEPQDLARLEQACRCLDEIEELSAVVKKEGRIVYPPSGTMREHPASKAVRELRIVFARLVREMGVDLKEAPESRPPRQYR